MKCIIPQLERIHGKRLEEICDMRYENGQSLPNQEGKVYSIYCKVESTLNLLQEIKQNPQSNYVIVTHESDIGITDHFTNDIPHNLKKWFAQNVECQHPKVESVPIGSVSSTWIGEKEKAYNTEYIDWLEPIHQYIQVPESGKEKQFINLVYMNFAIWTNPTHRKEVYDYFKDMDWVTTREGTLSTQQYMTSTNAIKMDKYYEELYNHKFTISPLGNGVDCGRVWQAICVGTIPIIPNHRNLDFYKELPILIYDNIEEITESYLNDKWEDMSNKKYDLSKATVSYWSKRINQEKDLR